MVEHDEQEKRIAKILGRLDVPVNQASALNYLDYLKEHIKLPCRLTGIEDFPWEEYYVMGPGSKKEYEKLKKKQPSYTDFFTLIRFDNDLDDTNSIWVEVERLTDKRKFKLPLADLEATDKDTKNYQLLDDFSVWFTNN
ncbi:MAG: hypothetical protein HKP58_01580 [Desulfatitalea sp.]|nr:calcium-binding protein [Desulfatitalea sp.]NNJ99078.1 hypothetical protein [Desulfatitalea sp.]